MNLIPNFRHGCGYALMIIRAMAPSYRGYKYIILDPEDPGDPPAPQRFCPSCGQDLLYSTMGKKRHYKPSEDPNLEDIWVEMDKPLDDQKATPLHKAIPQVLSGK